MTEERQWLDEVDMSGEPMYTAPDGYVCQNLMPEWARQKFASQRELPGYFDDDTFIPVAYLKLLTPDGPLTWYVSDFDGEDFMYGYVHNAQAPEFSEHGSFSLTKLEKLRGSRGLPVERDVLFKPTALSQLL